MYSWISFPSLAFVFLLAGILLRQDSHCFQAMVTRAYIASFPEQENHLPSTLSTSAPEINLTGPPLYAFSTLNKAVYLRMRNTPASPSYGYRDAGYDSRKIKPPAVQLINQFLVAPSRHCLLTATQTQRASARVFLSFICKRKLQLHSPLTIVHDFLD